MTRYLITMLVLLTSIFSFSQKKNADLIIRHANIVDVANNNIIMFLVKE